MKPGTVTFCFVSCTAVWKLHVTYQVVSLSCKTHSVPKRLIFKFAGVCFFLCLCRSYTITCCNIPPVSLPWKVTKCSWNMLTNIRCVWDFRFKREFSLSDLSVLTSKVYWIVYLFEVCVYLCHDWIVSEGTLMMESWKRNGHNHNWLVRDLNFSC